MKLKSVITLTLFALATQGIASAAVYKSSNANGAVTYRKAPATGNTLLPQSTIANAEVELFVTSWCPYCVKAEDFFRSRGIKITIYDIEKDHRAATRKSKLTRSRGVPFAVINGTRISGFSEEAYLSALKSKN